MLRIIGLSGTEYAEAAGTPKPARAAASEGIHEVISGFYVVGKRGGTCKFKVDWFGKKGDQKGGKKLASKTWPNERVDWLRPDGPDLVLPGVDWLGPHGETGIGAPHRLGSNVHWVVSGPCGNSHSEKDRKDMFCSEMT